MELHAAGYFGPGSRGRGPDIRRFRVKHALRSVEHALILLDSRPSEGIEIAALERIRDDLSILLRSPDVKH